MSKDINDLENQEVVLISTQEQAVDFSKFLLEAFRQKSKEHNKKHDTRVTANQLEKVYLEGVSFHIEYKCENFTKNEWGLARVNSFLKLTTGDLKVDLKVQGFNPSVRSKTMTLLSAINPNKEDFSLARKDIKKHNLNFEFKTVNDLFLTTLYSKTSTLIEIE